MNMSPLTKRSVIVCVNDVSLYSILSISVVPIEDLA